MMRKGVDRHVMILGATAASGERLSRVKRKEIGGKKNPFFPRIRMFMVVPETKGRTIKTTTTAMILTEVRAIPVHWSRATISNRGICLPPRMRRSVADQGLTFRIPRRERWEEGKGTILSGVVWSSWARNWAKLLPSLSWWNWT